MEHVNRLNYPPLNFTYINYKGETNERKIIPMNIWYGNTKYHKKDQWLMTAYDLDKGDTRIFAMNDIISFNSDK